MQFWLFVGILVHIMIVVITMSGNYVLDILSFFFTFLYIDELYSLDELIPGWRNPSCFDCLQQPYYASLDIYRHQATAPRSHLFDFYISLLLDWLKLGLFIAGRLGNYSQSFRRLLKKSKSKP